MNDTTTLEAIAPTTFAEAEVALAANLPGYTARATQQEAAARIEHALEVGDQLLLEAGTGCIQGDAELIVNRGGIGRPISLCDLVFRFGGGRSSGINSLGRKWVQPRAWRTDIPTYVQREVDGVVRLARLQSAWCSGVKQTYTVTTESGRTIRATSEHPFFTEDGWLRLDQLCVGSKVHVRGGQASGQHKPKIQYRTRSGLVGHPYAKRREAGRHAFRYPLHRLVAEADINGLDLGHYLSLLRSGSVADLTFLDPAEFAVHHRDGDSLNNNLSNLEVLSHHDHHAIAHSEQVRNVLYKVVSDKVVSIEPYGLEETYDIEVEGEPHNFIANGFVVHNTGKSIAYLIPAILSGKRVVVSTGTKALQDQLAEKDLPFLREHLGVDFTWALLKGKSNYLCQRDLAENAKDPAVAEVAVFIKGHSEETDGQRQNLPSVTDDAWRAITTTSDGCDGSACPWYEECYSTIAKRKAAKAQIVLINHALLCADLVTGGRVLGDYDVVIVDEAHELPAIATEALGGRVTKAGLTNAAAQVDSLASLLEVSDEKVAEVAADVDYVVAATEALYGSLEPGRLRPEAILALGDEWVDLANSLHQLSAVASTLPQPQVQNVLYPRYLRTRTAIDHAATRINSAIADDFAKTVRWVEEVTNLRSRKANLVIRTAPVEVGPILNDLLWSHRQVIAVSATLTTGGARPFEFCAGELGIVGYDSLKVGTPFDYPTQAALYVPTNIPLPNAPGRDGIVVAEVERIVRASKGRTLVLFTSTARCKAAHAALASKLPYPCLVQGEAPNSVLYGRFREEVDSVLFATRSFFTGIDVQGASLTTVIIEKLPFAVPTEPITEAKSEAITARGGSPFADLSLPSAIITLVQAFGRLIRTVDDRGVVAILDPRIAPGGKSYGKKVRNALPPAKVLTDFAAVEEFLSTC